MARREVCDIAIFVEYVLVYIVIVLRLSGSYVLKVSSRTPAMAKSTHWQQHPTTTIINGNDEDDDGDNGNNGNAL
jgi:hypothetical protein